MADKKKIVPPDDVRIDPTEGDYSLAEPLEAEKDAEKKKIVPPDDVRIDPTESEYSLSEPVEKEAGKACLRGEKPRDAEPKDSPRLAEPAGELKKPKKIDIRAIALDPEFAAARLAGGLALLLLLMVLLLMLGPPWSWFRGGENKEPVAAPITRPAPPPLPQIKPEEHLLPNGQKPGQPTAREEPLKVQVSPPRPGEQQQATGPSKAEPVQQRKSPLPDDVANWQPDDFARARRENDPRLLNAVEHLGQTLHGSEPAAQQLIDLLKPLPAESPPGPAGGLPVVRRRTAADVANLVETIVAALGNNGSELARATLEQILAGTFTTDNDRTSVEAALRALAAHPGAENNALLLRALTAAEELRPVDRQGLWPAKDLRLRAFNLVKSAATSEFRMKLAGALADRLFKSTDPQDPIRAYLLASDPLSCGAQVVLYESAGTPKEIKSRLEQQLAGYSSLALAGLMGLLEEASAGSLGRSAPASQPTKAVPADLAPGIAGQLWSERFCTLLESQLDELRAWDAQPQLVLLASTIPQESTRAALARTLRKHWNDGPKGLEAAGWSDRLITDPGLLVLIKTLLRKEPRSAKAPAAVPPRVTNPARAGTTAGSKASETAKQAAQKKAQQEQTEQDWAAVSSRLVAAWRKRLHAAAAAAEQPVGAAAPQLPDGFELGAGAKVMVAYHARWPDELPPTMSSLKPSRQEISYVCAEEFNRPKRAINFYSRQAQVRSSDVRTIDKSVWLDSLRPRSQNDRRRSLDVLITRTADKPGELTKDEEETNLVVEILTIEIKDPASRE